MVKPVITKHFILSCLVALIITRGHALIYHGVATPVNTTDAWVVTIDTTAVFHSQDFGLIWDSINIPTIRDFFDVFFLTPDSGWTCGRSGDIWATTDGGNTWTRQNLGGPKHAARIRFIDGEFGWAAGGDIVQLRTTNGGMEWQQIFLPVPPFPVGDTAEFQGVWFVNHNYGWLVAGHWPSGDTFLGGQGIIARTTNGGDSWQIVHRDTTYDFYDVYFADHNTGWVVGGNDRNFQAVILHTTDGGISWVAQNVPEVAKFLRAVKFVTPNLGWACGRNGTIIHTTNGGNTWIVQSSNADSTLFDIDFANENNGMAAGNGITVATTDGGEHWHPVLVGIQEGDLAPGYKPALKTTVLQNKLWCPCPGLLIDITGRKMHDLTSGINSLSCLNPGVYFIIYEDGRLVYSPQKVIIK
uniref:Photosynthesis system II assembly factor Ycf48/Hcf136-like domain-containing protein n=1 Tax=candidate division WOR-3 bacterium TaxID=2052148 RepID=A0A7V3PT29_UNCW3